MVAAAPEVREQEKHDGALKRRGRALFQGNCPPSLEREHR